MEEVEKIVSEAMKNLSEFCVNECHAYCCRKGYLPLSEEEVTLLCQDKKEELFEKGFLKKEENGKYLLNFDNNFSGCPRLKNFLCSIHNNPLRPKTCKDFPIFILGKEVKISNRCPGKKRNKFFKFEIEIEKLGYKIVDDFFQN